MAVMILWLRQDSARNRDFVWKALAANGASTCFDVLMQFINNLGDDKYWLEGKGLAVVTLLFGVGGLGVQYAYYTIVARRYAKAFGDPNYP